MKRGLIFFMIVFCLIIISNVSSEITGEVVTGEAITGEVTNQPIGMNVSVVVSLPTLTLITPKNHTYIYPEIILLNYSVTGTNQVWYNLNDTTNISLTGNTQFSAGVGSYTLNIYANNSAGIVTDNISFVMDPTRLTILHEEYNGTTKGSSTNFTVNSYDDLENISEVILENDEFGKILFNERINITEDEDASDNLVDLDTHVNVSYNRIELNSSGLPNFNKASTLAIYNLSFSNPRILRDGSVCSSSICQENSYSGGTLNFNVTGFSVYSADETPEVVTSPPGGSGGGGATLKKDIFSVDKELIKVKIKRGGKLSIPLSVINEYSTFLDFKIESNTELVTISEKEFRIEEGSSKEIELLFDIGKDIEFGVYSGKIIISTTEKVIEIPVVIEIESEKIIFDVSLDIPARYKEVFAGEDVLLQLTVFNLGGVGEAEVVMRYLIKDFEGNMVFSHSESINVGDQASFSKKIRIPENAKAGEYVAIAYAEYEDSFGTSSNMFLVKPKRSVLERYWIYIVSSVLLIVGLGIILRLIRKEKKLIKHISSSEREVRDNSEKINKLREEIKEVKKQGRTGLNKGDMKKNYKQVKDKVENLKKRIRDLKSARKKLK